jgi:YHS domain-containing protein
MKKYLPFLLAACASAGLLLAAQSETEIIAKARANYPLKTCLVSDEKIDLSDATPHIYRAAGKPERVIFTCCEGCVDDFKADPAKFLKKLDEAEKARAGTPKKKAAANSSPSAFGAQALAQQKSSYPLKTCAVSGEALGGMGEPYDYVHKADGAPDRLVRMCCSGCLKKFKGEPAKFLARIDAAAAQRS